MRNFILPLLLVFGTISAHAQSYIQGHNFIQIPTVITSAAGTTTLTVSSDDWIHVTGSTTQTIKLANATGLQSGRLIHIWNDSTGTVTVQYQDASTAITLPGGSRADLKLINNGTANGTWSIAGSSNATTVTAANGGTGVDSSAATGIPHVSAGSWTFSSIANADLAGSIADSKLLTISTAGKVSNSATTATNANTASAIVARDSSGNFSAGAITANPFTSSTASPADAGAVRLAHGDFLEWRNNGGTGNSILGVDTADGLTFNGSRFLSSGGVLVSTAFPVLAGDVSTPGNSLTTTIGAGKVTNSMLAGSIASSKLVGTDITTLGTIGTGTWNGTVIGTQYGGLGAAFNASSGFIYDTTGTMSAKTGTQATALLDAFVGDSGAGGTKGLVPAPAGGDAAAGKVLKADGTWGSAGTTSPLTTEGDLYYYHSAANARLPLGSDGQNLSIRAGTLAWRDQPVKNYFQANPDAEVGTDNWTVAKFNGTASASAPTSALIASSTTATAGFTWTRTTSSPLSGSGSFLLTHPASNTQSNYVSYQFSLDPKDQGNVVQISADYTVASGTYADNDLDIWILESNGSTTTITQPAPYHILNTTAKGKINVSFQPLSDTTTVVALLYSTTTTATAYTVKFDNWKADSVIKSYGPYISDWQSYTPTFTGFGTVSSVNIESRRIGDSLEIRGSWINGTVAASTASMTLGYSGANGNVTIDSTKVPVIQKVGFGSQSLAGAPAVAVLGTGAGTTLNFSTDGQSTIAPNVAQNGSAIFTTGSATYIHALVPIVGWSSGQLLSSDADTRVVAFAGTISATVNNTTPTLSLTSTYDTHAAYSGSTYTIPVAGYYEIGGLIRTGSVTWSAGNAIEFYVSINGGGNTVIGRNNQAAYTGVAQAPISYTGSFKAGDTLVFKTYSDVSNTSSGSVYVNRLSGPSQIAASETVSFSANTSTTAASTSTPFVYTVKDHDTHNAYSTSTGKFTAPVAGKYHFDAIYYTGATATYGLLYKNGSTVMAQGQHDVANTSVGVLSTSLSLLAGDTVEIRSGNAATASGAGYINVFSGFRIGN